MQKIPGSTAENKLRYCPHCHEPIITEAQIEHIAERAAVKASELMRRHFYEGVGAAVINRVLWLLGLVIVALAVLITPSNIFKG